MKGYKYRPGELKEDSTRGKAYVKPRSYKRDALVQAWVDRRKLAVLSDWLDDSGQRTKFLSDVLKFTIDIVVDQLIENGLAEKVELTEDAVRILDMKYNADLNPRGRGKRNLTHNLQLDEIRKGHSYDYEINRPVQNNSVYDEYRESGDALLRKYHRMKDSGELDRILNEKKAERLKEETKKQLDDCLYDENGVYIGKKSSNSSKPARHMSEEMLEAQNKRNEERDKFIAENDMMPPGMDGE